MQTIIILVKVKNGVSKQLYFLQERSDTCRSIHFNRVGPFFKNIVAIFVYIIIIIIVIYNIIVNSVIVIIQLDIIIYA